MSFARFRVLGQDEFKTLADDQGLYQAPSLATPQVKVVALPVVS